jgi:hypothetical protein
VQRWTDANPTPVTFNTAPGATTYTDTTAVANTIYYYRVINGNVSSNTFMGVVSDPTQPFNCPPFTQSANLGQDRTESFTATDGTKVSFTVHVPHATTMVTNLTPCNGAAGCDDYTNLYNALQNTGNAGGGTINMAAGDYYVDSKCSSGMYCPNIPILDVTVLYTPFNDITLSGANLDQNNIPTTHIHLGNVMGGNQSGLVIGSTNRTLVRNITIDQDRPNAIPGTVRNVVDAAFMGTIGAITSPYATLTVSAMTSGTIHPGTSAYLYDSAGQIGTLVQLINQQSGTTGGVGTYQVQFTPITPINAIASPIAMTSVLSQRFYVKSGVESYYVPNPASPPAPIRLDGYNWNNRTYDLRTGARNGSNAGAFNPNFSTVGNPDQGQYFWALSGGRNLPDGAMAVMFVPSGPAVNVGVAAVDTTLENVHIYGGAATGLLVPVVSQNLRVSNFKITHTPDSLLRPGEQQRYVSLIGDSDENNAMGNVVIENSEMGFVDDDSFYVRGPAGQVSTVVSTSEFTVWKTFQFHPATGGDTFRMIDPATYAMIGVQGGTLTNITCAPTGNPPQCVAVGQTTGYVWDVMLLSPITALAPYVGATGANLPVFGLPNQSGANLIIRNSCFHDNHGRIFPMAQNVLLDSNVFGNSYYGPIEVSLNQTNPGAAKPDGPGAWNVTVSNNKLIGSTVGSTDLATVWSPLNVTAGYPQTGWGTAAIWVYGIPSTGFFATGYPITGVQVKNNFISGSSGLAIGLNSVATGGVVGNTIVDANAVPFAAGFNATYCGGNSQGWQPMGTNQPWCLAKIAALGAIMITNSKNIDYTSTANMFLGTSAMSPSVYSDPQSVTYNLLTGSSLVH